MNFDVLNQLKRKLKLIEYEGSPYRRMPSSQGCLA